MDKLSQDDYVIIDNFLDEDLYKRVKCNFQSNEPNFTPAGIGALDQNSIHKEIRGDLTYWLDRSRDSELAPFWSLVDDTMHVFKRYCFLSLSGYEFHYALYPPGGHYDTHLDQFQGRNNRMISIIIYLNDNWKDGDGGELEIHRADGSRIVVQPTKGKCVMFKSAVVPHGVLRSKTERFSLTGWLLHMPTGLGQILG